MLPGLLFVVVVLRYQAIDLHCRQSQPAVAVMVDAHQLAVVVVAQHSKLLVLLPVVVVVGIVGSTSSCEH